MGFSNLSKIKPKNKAKILIGPQLIVKQIEDKYGDVSDKNALKIIPSFIEFVGCLIEEAYSSNSNVDKKKVNKKEELLRAIVDFTKSPLTEPEKKQISETIEYLHSKGNFKKHSNLISFFLQLLKLSQLLLNPLLKVLQ